MFRVEDLNKRLIIQPVQYLRSEPTLDNSANGGKVSTFFFPSMVFPGAVELLSMTLLNKHEQGDEVKKVFITMQKNNDIIQMEEPFVLKHVPGPKKLITRLDFPSPLLIQANQPFYFYYNGDMTDSGLTIAFRNVL